jgi:hypothetical protein
MQKWPLPNPERDDFPFKHIEKIKEWFTGRDTEYPNYEHPHNSDFPKGWSNPWPDLPNPDEEFAGIDWKNIKLSQSRNRCQNQTILGYYLSWHIVGVSFENEKGRKPYDGDELKYFNDTLPKENRFGIHICCNTIEEYIKKFSTDGLKKKDIPSYLQYCTFLTLIYVIAHEWGHYRSEVLSFQLGNLAKSVTGQNNSSLHPSYLSYFNFKKQYPDTNFEEVFAEYASLKLGVFNYYLKKPAFANSMRNWPRVEATLKYMLTQAISRPSRIRPYSDIRLWVDFNRLSEDIIINRIIENKTSTNRSVNDNVRIDNIKSLKTGKIIDLLMHNQMQFSRGHFFNGLVRSAPLSYPIRPDSSFYHFGDDDCLEGKDPSCTDNFVNLSYPSYSDPVKRKNSRILNALDVLKEKDDPCLCLPMKVFPEILPLDPVYFHT